MRVCNTWLKQQGVVESGDISRVGSRDIQITMATEEECILLLMNYRINVDEYV